MIIHMKYEFRNENNNILPNKKGYNAIDHVIIPSSKCLDGIMTIIKSGCR